MSLARKIEKSLSSINLIICVRIYRYCTFWYVAFTVQVHVHKKVPSSYQGGAPIHARGPRHSPVIQESTGRKRDEEKKNLGLLYVWLVGQIYE